MTLRQYEYALAIAEEGSVTAAAERLRVAQPSMSQQIRNLERDIGVALFARTSAGLVPTAVGRVFLREAQVAVSAARRATAAARAAADDVVGELVVSVQMGFGAEQLPRALAALRSRYPRLEVTVFEEPSAAELDRLYRRGALDLALMAECDQSPDDAYRLGEEEFVVVLGAGHPQLDTDHVDVRALLGQPWVRFGGESAVDAVLSQMLQDNDIAPNTAVRVTQASTAVRLAAGGLGATFIPASAVPSDHRHLARPMFPPVTQPVIAVLRHDAGPAETTLLDLLRKQKWPPVTSRLTAASTANREAG